MEEPAFRPGWHLTGAGLAARHFGWSTLLVDLLPSLDGPHGVPPAHWPAEGTVLGEALAMGREAAAALGGTLRRLP